jgi:hypothetical protein
MKLWGPARCAFVALTLAGACICFLPAVAAASQAMRLGATLSPERLGGRTSVGLKIEIATPANRIPAPMRVIDIRYPANIGIALSGLGIETCTGATLETLGPAGCPVDSVMGHGQALGEISYGPAIIRERATVTILRAEDVNGHIALLFDAQGLSPVLANIVFSGALLSARAPYGGDIQIAVPLVPSLPEAPDVAVVELSATIGPAAGLTYREVVRGRSISYTPKGILLPGRCPRGGFPFRANITFEDGSPAAAHTNVPCPAPSSRAKSSRARVHSRASMPG